MCVRMCVCVFVRVYTGIGALTDACVDVLSNSVLNSPTLFQSPPSPTLRRCSEADAKLQQWTRLISYLRRQEPGSGSRDALPQIRAGRGAARAGGVGWGSAVLLGRAEVFRQIWVCYLFLSVSFY